MSDFLKGNFKVDRPVDASTNATESDTQAFERRALARLAGSIAFVTKKGFLWTGETKAEGEASSGDPAVGSDRKPAR